jgi:PAS domain S-box-containing protein
MAEHLDKIIHNSEFRIIIAEDDKIQRHVLEQGLKNQNYSVVSFPSAVGVLEEILLAEEAGKPFDLIISDINMPGKTGIEIAKDLKDYKSSIKTILVSGTDVTLTLADAIKLGVVDYLRKPFRIDDLCKLINKVLEPSYHFKQSMHSLNLINSVPTFMIGFDPESKVCLVNNYFARRTGYSKQEITGMNKLDFLRLMYKDAEDMHTFRKVLDEVKKHGSSKSMELKLYPKLGKPIWVSAQAGSYGEYTNLSFTDITARKELEIGVDEVIGAILTAIDAKDGYTQQHCKKTADYVSKICKEMQIAENESSVYVKSAIVHDVGKIGVPDNVLLKPCALNFAEFELIKKHPIIGESIIRKIRSMNDCALLIRQHHIYYDGNGYPLDGVCGEDLPIGCRILSVADSYDAITTDRPYKNAKSEKEAVQILNSESGRQFDPEVVKAFLSVLSSG